MDIKVDYHDSTSVAQKPKLIHMFLAHDVIKPIILDSSSSISTFS